MTTQNNALHSALAAFETDFEKHLDELKTLARIPSVSFDGFPKSEVVKSAEAVAALLKRSGLDKVEILPMEGTHPYVYGERLRAPGKPTLILYAHHDVQPAGRTELWKTPPFEPTLKEGPGGMRLYGRGTADDKAGVVIHTAAIASWLKATAELPLNVKVVIEGEEEIGSTKLGDFLKRERHRLDADVLVLTDTSNYDCGVPALTIALRGLVGVDVEVRGLSKTVHSGMWGGPIPDPVQALAKVLATLSDADGRIAVPGVLEQVPPVSAAEAEELAKFPYNEADFRKQSGMLPNVRMITQGPQSAPGVKPVLPTSQLWRYPSLTVTAIQASSRAQAANIINDAAWARVTIRLCPGMDPAKTQAALEKHIRAQVPWGMEVELTPDQASPGWSTDTEHPAFAAAGRAMKIGYGKDPLHMGCGGSIPFVGPFADALGGAPALLIGVEDPYTNAHGENESLLVSDFKKACISQIHLFAQLAELPLNQRNKK